MGENGSTENMLQRPKKQEGSEAALVTSAAGRPDPKLAGRHLCPGGWSQLSLHTPSL